MENPTGVEGSTQALAKVLLINGSPTMYRILRRISGSCPVNLSKTHIQSSSWRQHFDLCVAHAEVLLVELINAPTNGGTHGDRTLAHRLYHFIITTHVQRKPVFILAPNHSNSWNIGDIPRLFNIPDMYTARIKWCSYGLKFDNKPVGMHSKIRASVPISSRTCECNPQTEHITETLPVIDNDKDIMSKNGKQYKKRHSDICSMSFGSS